MNHVRIAVRAKVGPCYALVDAEDALAVEKLGWIAYRNRNVNYASNGCFQNAVLMHHVIAERMGIKGASKYIDHINRDGLDNRRSNLRPADSSQNIWNQVRALGVSKFPGVHKNGNNWAVRFDHRGSVIYLGTHKDIERAKQVSAEFLLKERGEYLSASVRQQCIEALQSI